MADDADKGTPEPAYYYDVALNYYNIVQGRRVEAVLPHMRFDTPAWEQYAVLLPGEDIVLGQILQVKLSPAYGTHPAKSTIVARCPHFLTNTPEQRSLVQLVNDYVKNYRPEK